MVDKSVRKLLGSSRLPADVPHAHGLGASGGASCCAKLISRFVIDLRRSYCRIWAYRTADSPSLLQYRIVSDATHAVVGSCGTSFRNVPRAQVIRSAKIGLFPGYRAAACPMASPTLVVLREIGTVDSRHRPIRTHASVNGAICVLKGRHTLLTRAPRCPTAPLGPKWWPVRSHSLKFRRVPAQQLNRCIDVSIE